MSVDFTLRCSDVATQCSNMIVRVYFGHNDIHIPIQQLRPFVPKQMPYQIIRMGDIAQLSLIASDDHHSCLRVLVVLAAGLIDLRGIFDVLADDVCLLEVLHVVALLVGYLK